jgi:pyrroloquinoline quinone (PQQ) biosynthesis protein C
MRCWKRPDTALLVTLAPSAAANLLATANALGITLDEIELPNPVQSTRPHYEAWRSRVRRAVREPSRTAF